MDATPINRVSINGKPVPAAEFGSPVTVSYGHYTSMQVRGRQVRGFDLHLARLDQATRELFDIDLDRTQVRERIRDALGVAVQDASVRVTVFRPNDDAGLSVMVEVSPPAEPSARPQRLRTVNYQRPVAHLKHVGTFAQIFHALAARREGYDDALLIGADGIISETTIANIGFLAGDHVVWPDAPVLRGITMQLLDLRLAERGIPMRREQVRISDLGAFDGAFLANSIGIVPVGQIDAIESPVRTDHMRAISDAYESTPWHAI